jgi:hypothetical protein
MPLQRIEYHFTTKLPADAARAFKWATNFQATDLELMGFNAKRSVQILTKDSLLLTDSFGSDPFAVRPGARVTKVKLVHLLPAGRRWTSTHVTGPTRNSQFLYEIVPRGRTKSLLRYTGVQLESVSRRPTAGSVAKRVRELTRIDSRSWRKLAIVMGKDLE